MKRLKVAIIFGTEPNFDKYAFKYFLLYINKIQKSYEFSFPDVTDYPFEKTTVDFDTCNDKIDEFVKINKLVADHCISIISISFSNNFFLNAKNKTSVITTDFWEKHFSPPSLFEYLVHCIYTCLIYSRVVPKNRILTDEEMLINIRSHEDTRGCIADHTRQKYDDRVDISIGYICEEHTEQIKKYYGEDYLNEVQLVIDRKWIGTTYERNSVAYNLKHVFKININKDSGFNKSFWDKIKDKFYEIPGSLTGEILKIALTALLTYYLVKMGLVDKSK